MRALDLFCCAGGATRGYQQAGFHVVGVDKLDRPRYCGDEFIKGDALDVLRDVAFLRTFDLIAASPPCQFGSTGSGQWGTRDRHENLIPQTRELLQVADVPYVIENIEPNLPHLIDPTVLCGEMFDLGVFRHRGFEVGGGITLAQPHHPQHRGRVGDGKYVTVTGKSGGRSVRDGIQHGAKADWERAMGIDWMSTREMAQAIPPAYTRWIGQQIMPALVGQAVS
ncbi:DNA cytosine methyltransferase [Micromonospora sp. NBC_00362]|uniref:DNA cytosine methyltransferase n=1 Tax=Micromonospora sp. NBC_00362 TaxID=2975975 RepID=UPI00224F439A|nr:DNA cytosine methyltransferase [Micromonospora sp. NBC_00362]MCX5119244.1 DNA cytosine methyltransferase [Micromonospora sp. NBC_00362]